MAIIVIEDYTPIYVGNTGAIFAPVFQHKDQSPVNLSSASITLTMVNDNGTPKTGTGTWTIDDANNGLAHYNFSAADVNTAGNWMIWTNLLIGGVPVPVDPKPLVIKSLNTPTG